MSSSSNVQSTGRGEYTHPSLMKASSGATGLISSMIYRMMAMYAQIVAYDAEQKQTMLTAQSNFAQAQADATKAAGEDCGKSMIAAGSLTVASTVVGTAASMVTISRGTKEANEDLRKLEPENAKVTSITKFNTTLVQEGNGAGDAGRAELAGTAAERKQEFLAGNFSKASVVDGNLDADSMTAIRSIKAEGGAGYEELRGNLKSQKQGLVTEINSKMQSINASTSTGSAWDSRISQLGSAGSSIAQGKGSMEKGNDDAQATLAGTATNMAGSTANDMGTAMSKAVDAMLNEIQVLERVQQASSGR